MLTFLEYQQYNLVDFQISKFILKLDMFIKLILKKFKIEQTNTFLYIFLSIFSDDINFMCFLETSYSI